MSIAAWKIRVEFPFKWGADGVDAVLVVKRASVEQREEFDEVLLAATKHHRSFADAAAAKTVSPSKQKRLIAEADRVKALYLGQIREFIIGVEGVVVETAPGEESNIETADALIEAFGSSPEWIGKVWRKLLEAQHVAPELGNASGATPGS